MSPFKYDVASLKDRLFKKDYHVDAFYNFEKRQWFQKSTNSILPTNAWLNETWKVPRYPLIFHTIIVTGR